MNIPKNTLVVEKSTCKILCNSLISKFNTFLLSFSLYVITKKYHTFLNKKDILKVIH